MKFLILKLMINGKLYSIENGFRLETKVFKDKNKSFNISLHIDKTTNICQFEKDESKCVIFLNGEHVVINESYESINNLIIKLNECKN